MLQWKLPVHQVLPQSSPAHCSALSLRKPVHGAAHARDVPGSQQGHLGFVVQSKVIPCLILISLLQKMVCFSSVHFGDYFSNNNAKKSRCALNLLPSFKLKVRPLQIKGCYFSNHSLYMALKGTWIATALCYLLPSLSFVAAASRVL